jgi:hypothetical protein
VGPCSQGSVNPGLVTQPRWGWRGGGAVLFPGFGEPWADDTTPLGLEREGTGDGIPSGFEKGGFSATFSTVRACELSGVGASMGHESVDG